MPPGGPGSGARSGACERCHRRKVRCDKIQPQCSPCARANSTCRYVTSEHQLRRRNVQRLEARIKDLQDENENLTGQLRRRSVEAAPVPQQPPEPGIAEHHQHHNHNGASYATSSVSFPEAGSSGPHDGEVADQVIHLSLIAGGGQHFVGSTSGLLLANLLQSRPQSSAFPDSLSSWQQPNSIIPEAGLGSTNNNSSPPSSSLPPKALARELIAAYCSHDHLCYPFISTKALSRSLDAVYDAESRDKVDPCDAFFVDMTLAIGTAQVHKFNWNGMYDAETHYNRAMTRLVDVLARDGITRVQALLLVCQYRMGTTSSNTTTSVWHLIGVAARTCLELGLHRASAYVVPPRPQQGTSPQDRGGEAVPAADSNNEVAEEIEIKRRCFWSLVALDRVTSLAMGRPFAIQLDDIEVDLPYSSADTIPTANTQVPVSLSSPAYGTPQWDLATSVFVHIVKYRLICGKILTSLHRNNKHKSATTADVDYEAVREDLSRELQDWHAETSNLPLVPPSTTAQPASPARVSSFRSEEWYRLLYHNGMLMLYRPSPCLCDASRNSTVLRRIFESSRESINLYATLHRSKKMNYSWITMHTVFMAGLSYIYALRNHLQALQSPPAAREAGKATLQSTPTINQVVNDTRACFKVLVAVSERWDLARTCSELFDRLSDAVVADIVEATTAAATPALHNTATTAPMPPQLSPASNMGLPVATPTNFHGEDIGSFFNMTVDSTLRDCYPDLQNLGYDQYHSDAIAQLSQDWFFGIGDPGNRYF